MVNGEHPPGASQTGLDLIGDEEDIVLLAELEAFGEVAIVRDKDTTSNDLHEFLDICCCDFNSYPASP